MISRFATLLLPLLFSITAANAQFNYIVTNGTATITGYTGGGGPVTIPTTLGGKNVTAIADYAFATNSTITSLLIPNSVQTIGNYSFAYCSVLTSVRITNSASGSYAVNFDAGAFYSDYNLLIVTIDDTASQIGTLAFASTGLTNFTVAGEAVDTSIGVSAFQDCLDLRSFTFPGKTVSVQSNAFYDCTALTNVVIPKTLTSLGEFAFGGCYNIQSFSVQSGNTAFKAVNGALYNAAETELIQYPGAKAGSFTIPSGVTTIDPYALAFCFKLTALTLPASVRTIGDYAAFYCLGLTNATFPSGPGTVGNYMFTDCSLYTITLPNSITNIGVAAFSDNYSLQNIIIPPHVATIGAKAFEGCALSSVTVPASVINIGEEAFAETSLTTINVDSSNPNYSSLAGVLFNKSQTVLIQYPTQQSGAYSIPTTVTNIGDYSFERCWSLTQLTIPSTVLSIGTNAFENCYFTNLIIPASVQTIGDAAFAGASLESVSLPSGLTQIGDSVFSSCGLGSITIPDTVTSIGPNAFYGCDGLTNVVLGTNVASIGADAFQFCYALRTITIPASVVSIGDGAFSQNFSFSAIYFLGEPPAAGMYVFDSDDSNPIAYYLPGTPDWGTMYAGIPATSNSSGSSNAPKMGNAGISGNQFGFTLTGTGNESVVIEVSTDLVHWTPLQTNVLSGGSANFSDPQWKNYPRRFYRAK